jgi:protein-S-isoprenylcysteine O-methyltransferase Ste14
MRFVGLVYSTVVYVAFLAVFLYTIGFVANVPWLPKTIDSGAVGDPALAIAVNIGLLGLFAVQHSLMARQGFKRQWTRIVPEPLERSTFVLAATLAIALLLWQWRPLPEIVWSAEDTAARALLAGVSALGWLTLLIATFLINHFELFGLHQAYDRWRGRSFAPPDFKTPGLYRLVRHPIYLGFVVAFWATPQMSMGHLLFAVATTGYIFVGIWFEERDLVARFGATYRDYRRRVPMLVPFLGKGVSKRAEERVSPPRG